MGKLIALFMLAVLLVGYPFYGSYLPFGPLAAKITPRPRATRVREANGAVS